MKQKETEQRQKMMFFCLICCGFKAKREEIGNKSFGCDGKTERIFPAQMFFVNQETRNRKKSFSNVGIHINGVKKRNRVKKKNFLKGK